MTSFNTEAIGARIKAERKLQGMTRPDLMKKSGIGLNTIMLIENGGECMSLTLWCIANALGVTPDYLIGCDEGPKVAALRKELQLKNKSLRKMKAMIDKILAGTESNA